MVRGAYSGLRIKQAKRLKSLEKENGRLKKLVEGVQSGTAA